MYTLRKAYPPVITTLGKIDEKTKTYIFLMNACKNMNEVTTFKKKYMDELHKEQENKHAIHQINNLLGMYFVGVSHGLAYAHPNSGDTVASVMVGGLKTVRNGHFQAHTNDPLMWYHDGEENMFDPEVSMTHA
jgi:hypothetical protein